MNNHSALHAILRTRFDLFYQRAFAELNPGTPYQHNWHMDAIIHVLQGVINGDIRRLIINMPPRYGKSLATTVALSAYLLGLDRASGLSLRVTPSRSPTNLPLIADA